MSNLFDAVAQVYDLIQVLPVTTLLDGRIYQNRMPTIGEEIGEGRDRFIVIGNLEPNIYSDQLLKEIPINISVFCKELDYSLPDVTMLDLIEKAIDTALDDKTNYNTQVGYTGVSKVFSHILSENPFSKKHTLMVIRINLIINRK